MIPRGTKFDMSNYFHNVIWAQYSGVMAKLTGSSYYKKDAMRRMKALMRQYFLNEMFKHFMNYEWFFESHHVPMMLSKLSPAEVDEFQCDPKVLDWDMWAKLFYYGIRVFIFKQQCISPLDSLSNIVARSERTIVGDAIWTFRNGIKIPSDDKTKTKNSILFSETVQKQVEAQVVKRKKTKNLS